MSLWKHLDKKNDNGNFECLIRRLTPPFKNQEFLPQLKRFSKVSIRLGPTPLFYCLTCDDKQSFYSVISYHCTNTQSSPLIKYLLDTPVQVKLQTFLIKVPKTPPLKIMTSLFTLPMTTTYRWMSLRPFRGLVLFPYRRSQTLQWTFKCLGSLIPQLVISSPDYCIVDTVSIPGLLANPKTCFNHK